MDDLLQSWRPLLSSGYAAGVMIALFAGVVVTVYLFWAARYIATYKHRDWKFRDAANYIARKGALGTLIFALVIAAVWLVPRFVALPFSEDQILAAQLIAIGITFVAINVHWYAIVLRHIRRPPEG